MKLQISKKEKRIMKLIIDYLYSIILALVIVALVIIFVKIMIPFILSLVSMFLGLFYMWASLEDVNFKFIGGIFFFLVLWNVFKSIFWIWLNITEKVIEYYINVLNKIGYENKKQKK